MKKFILLLLFSFSAFGYLTPGTGGGGGSGNIVSINGDTTAAQLISGGTGITTATVAGNTTVTATGSGGVTTMTAFGASPNANAGTISGANLTLQPASATAPGGIALAAQTMGTGAKTFSSNILCATAGGCSLGVTGTKFSSGFFATAVQYGATSTIDGTVNGVGQLDFRNATTGSTVTGMGHFGLSKVSGSDNNSPSISLFSHGGYGTNINFAGGSAGGSIGNFFHDGTYSAGSGNAPLNIAIQKNMIWDTDGSGDIGSLDGGTTPLRPANLFVLTKINLASLTASSPVFTDSSKNLVSTGTVGVAQGGTGLGTLTANNVILGNGTSTPSFVAPGTSGNALISNGTTWTSAAIASFTFTSVSSNVTLACNSYNFVSTAAARSLTLPTPTSGCIINVKDVTGTASTNNISLLRHASEQIEGVASTFVYATNYGSVQLVADGTNWWAF